MANELEKRNSCERLVYSFERCATSLVRADIDSLSDEDLDWFMGRGARVNKEFQFFVKAVLKAVRASKGEVDACDKSCRGC